MIELSQNISHIYNKIHYIIHHVILYGEIMFYIFLKNMYKKPPTYFKTLFLFLENK